MPLIDYLLLVPLDEEWRSISGVLTPPGQTFHHYNKSNTNSYYLWSHPVPQDPERGIDISGEYLIAGASLSRQTPGQAFAAAFSRHALSTWHPSRVVMMGIAGSLDPQKLLLGDVVVSDKIYGYEVGDAGKKITFRRTVNQSGALDLDRVRSFLLDGPRYTAWQNECLQAAALLPQLPASCIHPPTLHIANTASGNYVVKSVKFANRLKKELDWSVEAVEMEATGLFQALYLDSGLQNALMIRGISDYADENKEQLDKSSHNSVRAWCSGNAARLLQAIWKSAPFAPVSPRYQLNVNRGTPSRLRQKGIPHIAFKQQGSQALSFPHLLHHKGATPPTVLRVVPRNNNGTPLNGKGLCVIDNDPARTVPGKELETGGLFFELPPSEQGLQVELLLSYDHPANEIQLEYKDNFQRKVTASVTI